MVLRKKRRHTPCVEVSSARPVGAQGTSMTSAESDFDVFRDDFLLYLAARLGVTRDAALSYLGDWLIAFTPDTPPPIASTAAGGPWEEPDFAATNGAETVEG